MVLKSTGVSSQLAPPTGTFLKGGAPCYRLGIFSIEKALQMGRLGRSGNLGDLISAGFGEKNTSQVDFFRFWREKQELASGVDVSSIGISRDLRRRWEIDAGRGPLETVRIAAADDAGAPREAAASAEKAEGEGGSWGRAKGPISGSNEAKEPEALPSQRENTAVPYVETNPNGRSDELMVEFADPWPKELILVGRGLERESVSCLGIWGRHMREPSDGGGLANGLRCFKVFLARVQATHMNLWMKGIYRVVELVAELFDVLLGGLTRQEWNRLQKGFRFFFYRDRATATRVGHALGKGWVCLVESSSEVFL